MFAFKAMSISNPIADPIAAGTTIPAGSVIFVANDLSNITGVSVTSTTGNFSCNSTMLSVNDRIVIRNYINASDTGSILGWYSFPAENGLECIVTSVTGTAPNITGFKLAILNTYYNTVAFGVNYTNSGTTTKGLLSTTIGTLNSLNYSATIYPYVPSNWSFINMTQSDGTPSHIRGCTSVSGASQIFTRSITNSFTTSTVGSHSGMNTFQEPYYRWTNYLNNQPYSAQNNPSAGAHSHSVSGLSSTSNLGGKYLASAVVGGYKCITTTKVIPKNAIIFANSVQNEDFVSLNDFNNGNFDGCGLISGSLSWVTANATANNGIYGEDLSSIIVNPSISSGGDHNHIQSGQNGNQVDTSNVYRDPTYATYQYYYYNSGALGNPSHTHNANNMSVSASTKVQYWNAYKTVRDTSVYKGMMLGWTGTVASTLPKGWYICNGQTINGYTTPQANTDAVISMTSLNVFSGYIEGTDDATVTYAIGGTQGQHSHYTQGTNSTQVYKNGNINDYHKDNFPWNHRHDSTTTLTYKQAYYTLNFIIYLG